MNDSFAIHSEPRKLFAKSSLHLHARRFGQQAGAHGVDRQLFNGLCAAAQNLRCAQVFIGQRRVEHRRVV